MAPNNALAAASITAPNNVKKSSSSTATATTTTVLKAGTVSSRGTGTARPRTAIAREIHDFLHGPGRLSWRAETRAFFTVWTFLTRLPGPTWTDHHPAF